MGTTKKRGNGEGTIFKREIKGKTLWVTEYTIEMYDKNGKRKRRTVYGKTRQEVKDKLAKIVTELNTDTYVDKNKITFVSIAKEIVEDGYKLNKLSDSSYNRKLGTIGQIETHYIANMEIQKITSADVKDFLFYITKYSNSVIGKIYGLVNNVFKRAVRKNIIRYNFLDDNLEFCKPKSSHKDKKVSAFTLDEQRHFLKVIMDNDNSILYKYQMLLSMYTGMRMGEINALDINNIDFAKNIINVKRTLTKDKNDKTIMGDTTKTNHGERVIIIDNQIKFILEEYINKYYVENKENLLFYNIKDNKYITTSQVNMVFKRLCEKYNIGKGYDVNQHMLRHTFATRCIEAGMPANVLQKIVGHNDLRTTLEIYCDVFAEYEKQHANRTYDYLRDNQLLLNQIQDDTLSKDDLNKILDNIKEMYSKQDERLVEFLKLVA